MTSNRRGKAAIRARQTATGVPYMVARRQVAGSIPVATSVGEVAARVDILPPLSDWNRPRSCQFWAETAARNGPLIALTISQGNRWWELDDLARGVAGALQSRPTEERGLWMMGLHSRYIVTKREHLDGIAAALDAAGELSRLTVRAMPDAARCEHTSCQRRRGEPPIPGKVTSRPSASRPRLALGRTSSLAEVMERHPQLTSFGIGTFNTGSKTTEQRLFELADGRTQLVDREAAVLKIAAWLRANVAPIKTPMVSSYNMKHEVEKAIGEYVTNGELIAAALIAGYAFKHTDGPNLLFGMSKRDVKRVADVGRPDR